MSVLLVFSITQSSLVLRAPTLAPLAALTLLTVSPAQTHGSLMEIPVLAVMATTMEGQPLASHAIIVVSRALIALHV